MKRLLAVSVCASVLFGCGGSGGSSSDAPASPGPFNSENLPTFTSFFDNFSGVFPGGSWRIREGAPDVDPIRGNPAAGLAMNAGRIQSGFLLSTVGPFSISVEVGTPDAAPGRFRFELERAFGETAAAFEIRLDEGVIRFEIQDQVTDVPFPGDTVFHAFGFGLNAVGVASWTLDGGVVATRPHFPNGAARLDLRAYPGARFTVDNLLLMPSESEGGGGAGGVVWEFADDFSNGFPDGKWEVEDGDPFLDKDMGNPGSCLMLGPATNSCQVESLFAFSTAEALSLSFDFAAFDLTTAPDGVLKFELKRDSQAESEASIEIWIHTGEIKLLLLGSETKVTFTPDLDFHHVSFELGADGVASWWIDGAPAASRAGFPQGFFRIRIGSTHRADTGFVLDNVVLDRP